MNGTETPSVIEQVARRARQASRAMLSQTSQQRQAALQAMHASLQQAEAEILHANQADKTLAQQRLEQGNISAALVKRLDLSGRKFKAMLTGVESVANLPDPVDQCLLSRELDTDLQLYRVACPIGVICVIFEARPEAAVQIASLAVKSANAVILKGGKEAEQSNKTLVNCIRQALESVKFPVDAVQLVETREQVAELLKQKEFIDLVIPRGGNELVRYITQNTHIPVMGHADGICSVYVDRCADVEKAIRIVVDAKSQYPAVCNAAETLLVHNEAVQTVLPSIGKALAEAGVQVRADEKSMQVLKQVQGLKVMQVTEQDFDTEFLELILAVKVVDDLQQAVDHINLHGSGHTDCIVTEDEQTANLFMRLVDSAGVYHNASTRFADGFRYGFGAEVGVSTHRTHARGPVGVEGLMIYKYKLVGDGHIVAPYVAGEKQLNHLDTPDRQPPA